MSERQEGPERTAVELLMLAAWCGVPVDKLPQQNTAHANEHTMAAWNRVAMAALDFYSAGAYTTLLAEKQALEAEVDCWKNRALHQNEVANRMEAERDRLAQEVERIREACHHISLIEQDSSTAAHVKIREAARIARTVLRTETGGE